jgi:hypothetical protein
MVMDVPQRTLPLGSSLTGAAELGEVRAVRHVEIAGAVILVSIEALHRRCQVAVLQATSMRLSDLDDADAVENRQPFVALQATSFRHYK